MGATPWPRYCEEQGSALPANIMCILPAGLIDKKVTLFFYDQNQDQLYGILQKDLMIQEEIWIEIAPILDPVRPVLIRLADIARIRKERDAES